MADFLNVGDPHPDAPLAESVTTAARAVPGLDPQHVVAAAQTSDPVEAAHTLAGMNILANHLSHYGAMQGVQGISGAADTGLGGVKASGEPTEPNAGGGPGVLGRLENIATDIGGVLDIHAPGAPDPVGRTLGSGIGGAAKFVGGAAATAGSIVDPWEWATGHNPLNSKERAQTFNWGQNFGTGASQAVGGSLQGAEHWVNSTGAGLVNLPGRFVQNPMAVLDQFRHDVANDVDLGTNFFPRLYRYYTQTVHDKGAAYAEGQLFGIIATAMATGGVGDLGAGADAAGEGVAAAENEGTLASRLAGATAPTRAAYNFYRDVADSPVTKFITAPTKLVTVPARIAGELGTSSAGATAEALLTAQQGGDGSDAARWAQTADGKTWINPYGKQFATFGQMVMHLMGIDPTSWAGHIGSGILDFYSSFIMPDPLGAAGNAFHDARSLEGSAGLLHGLFGGTAIRSADDIDRIYAQYPSFQRTVDKIASTPAGRLSEMYKGKISADLLLQLGRADTPEKVLDVLKKSAASVELTDAKMVTLGGYTRTKDAIKAATRAADGLPPLQIKTARDLVDSIVWPATAEFKRIGSYFARTLAQRGFWIDSETGVVMTDKIVRADAAAIHVIQGRLRQAGMAEDIITQVGHDLLRASRDEDFTAFTNIVRNTQKVAWKGYLQARLSDPALADWVKALGDRSDEMLDQMLGFSGVGKEGLYTTDPADSLLVDSKDEPVATAGASTSHKGGVPLLSAKDMRRAIKVLVNIGKNDDLNELARPLAIAGKTDATALRAIAETLKATGEGLSDFRNLIKNVFDHAEKVGSFAPDATGEEAALKLFAPSRMGKYESVLLNLASGAGTTAEKLNQYRQWLLDEAKNSDEVGRLEANMISALIDTHLLGRSIDYSSAFETGARGVGAEAENAYMQRFNELAEPYKGNAAQVLRDVPLGQRKIFQSAAMTGDFIDHVINDLFFKPLTLSSPGWAWHVAASEAILNTFRYGPMHMLESRFASTIASKAAKYSLSPGVDFDHVRDAVSSLLQEFGPADIRALRNNGLTDYEREHLIEQGLSESEIKAAKEALIKDRKVVRGTLAGLGIGVRESILKGLAGDAQAERLIGDAMDLTLLHPGGINPALSASHTAYIESTAGQSDFSEDRVPGTRMARWSKKFTTYDTRDFGHLNALQHFVGVTLASPEHQYVGKLFVEALDAMGEEGFIKAIQDTREEGSLLYRKADVIKEIEGKVTAYLQALPTGERDALLRTKFFSENAKHFSDITTPDEDFARVLVKENLNAWMSRNREILHRPILDQVAEHDVRSLKWYKDYARKVGKANMPSNIIGPEIMGGRASRLGLLTPVGLSNLSHEKMLGPMVDYISRQPTYLLAYHREMEAIRATNGVFTTTVGDALDALKAERDAAHSRIDALNAEWGQKAARLTELSGVATEKYQVTKQAQRDLIEAQNRLSDLVATHESSKEAVAAAANEFNAQTRRLTQARADEEKANRAYEAAVRQTGEIRRLERKVAAVHARFYRMDLPELSDKGQPILSPEEYFAKGPSESLFQREAAARAELMTAQDDYRAKVEQARRARESASATTREQSKSVDAAQSVVKSKRVVRDQAFADVREGSKTANAAQRTADKARKEIQALHDQIDAAEQEMLDAIGRIPENQDKIANEVGRIAELNEKITNHVVQPGMIHEAQAQVIAEQRAARKMIGEVHNPADKTNFEAAMSRFAPFYFAQNQAWRRAFRLLAEDPGAFERYMKLTLAVTNFAHKHMVNGIPMLELPMAMFGMNIFADLSSLKSLTPFGTSGDTSWSGLFRDTAMPALGPIGMIVAEGMRDGLGAIADLAGGKKAALTVDNAFTYAEGTSSAMPMSAQLIPNTLFRNIAVGIWDYTHIDGSGDPLGTSYISTRLQVYKELTQETLDNIGKQLLTQGFGNYNAATMQYVLKTNPAMFSTYETMAFAIKAQRDPNFLQGLADVANNRTAQLWTLKTAMGFFGPTSVSLENVKGTMLSTELENNIAQLGVTAGYAKFSKDHPLDAMTEVFTTAHPYGVSYPSTQEALNFIDNSPSWVQNHQGIASFFIPRTANSPYSQAARSLELTMGLSARQNLSGLANQERIVWGNNWYYGMVVPAVEAQVNANQITSYQASTQLKALRASYATANPTWSTYYNNQRQQVAVQSYRQLADFYNTKDLVEIDGQQVPAIAQTWPPQSQQIAANIARLLTSYNLYTSEAANLSGTQKYDLETAWYNYCQGVVANFPALSSVITTVFNRLPSTGVLNG